MCLFHCGAIHAGEPERQDVTFVSHDTLLSGTLYLPVAQVINSAVVFVHGSGAQLGNKHLAREFALRGVAALVYDKRGVGDSAGEYESEQSVSEHNINLLADDAVAAVEVLATHDALKEAQIGLTGISQAGWIIPIAATKHNAVQFMVLWSGPVCKVSEEDIYSKYTADIDSDRVPNYDEAVNARTRDYRWPAFLGKDTDPGESLSRLQIPGLWIFGEHDGSIPVDLSTRRLDQLNSNKARFDYRVIPHVGHNNITDTFDIAIEWITALSN